MVFGRRTDVGRIRVQGTDGCMNDRHDPQRDVNDVGRIRVQGTDGCTEDISISIQILTSQ